uniref:Bet v I/Major latex protein domain-containing protein n=1 Tax=Phaseolus vulgaris TaxID=3885 RepID=V7BUZ0_PHAVU|nr:hypothetical protein PHAVU_005G021700g [Phaseolus vulgaris]ESW20870.1 hypothetical protein PHAVU_005G021700g [Phaseolus vulgaris]
MSKREKYIETKVHLKASAQQFYDVFCNRPHHIANILPKKYNEKKYVAKEVVEGINKENCKLSFKVLEGDLLGLYKSFKTDFQVTPKGNGSVVQWTLVFEKQENHIPDPHTLLQLVVEMSKNIDSYLTQENN